MEEEVVVRMSAKDESIVRAWQAGRNSVAAYNAQLGKLDDTQRANAKAAAEFDRANNAAMRNAKKVIDDLMTPQQRYQKSLEDLSSLHSRGALTVEQYLAAMKKEKAAYDAADPAQQKAAERKRQLETAGRQLTESTRTAAEKYRAEIARLNEIKAAGTSTEEAYARGVRKAREELLKVSGHITKREQAERSLMEAQQRAAAIAKQLETAGRQLTESTRTAAEKYRAEVARLNELRNAGAVSEETHARGIRKAREELIQASGRVDERKRKEAELAAQLKEAKRHEEERGAAARRVLAEIQTPQQRYNEKIKEYSQLRKENRLTEEQFAAAVKKSREELDASSNSMSGGSSIAEAFTGKLVGIASAIGGVAAIAATLKAEYQDLLERQGKAGETQVTLAAAQRGAVFNLGNDQTLTPETMTAEIKKIAAETGVKEEMATRVFSDMLSARGDMQAADVLPRLREVLRTAPDQAGLPVLGGATMSLGTEFGLTGKESLGFMMQTQAASPVVSLESLAHHSVPAVVSVSKFGDSPEQAAELVSGLASAGKDSRGAESGTASVQLAARLAKILPDAKSTSERIEMVRKSKGLQTKVFEDEFGEARYKPIFREFLTGGEDTPTVKAYRAAQEAITSPQEAGPVLDNLLAQYDRLPLAGSAAAKRTMEAGADQLQTGDIFGGQSGIARKGLEDMLSAANVPKIDRDFTLSQFDLATQVGGSAPIGEAAANLEQKAQSRLQPVDVATVPTMGFGGMAMSRQETRRAPTAEEKRTGEGLAAVAKALRDLQASIDKNNVKVEQNNQQLDKVNRNPAPVMLNTTPPGKPASAENSIRNRGQRLGAAP